MEMNYLIRPLTQENLAIPTAGYRLSIVDDPEDVASETWSNDAVMGDDEATSLPQEATSDPLTCTTNPVSSTGSGGGVCGTADTQGSHSNSPTSEEDSETSRSSMESLLPDRNNSECRGLVTVKQPGPVRHQSPASAYAHLMSGKFVAIFNGLLFVPDATYERPFHLKGGLLALPLWERGVLTLEGQQAARHFLKYAKSGVPRFLFRGFNSRSGGGGDPRLNGHHGVVPHAFLGPAPNPFVQGDPTDMWSHEFLYYMSSNHINGCDILKSPFSSWTHVLGTALKFARAGDSPGSAIAVLDTASAPGRAWHTRDLLLSGLAYTAFPDEFLVYGPVGGPGYHCTPARELEGTTRIRDIMRGPLPGPAFGTDRVSSIERGAVESSRAVAAALRPPGAGLDSIVMLTARFVGVRACSLLGGADYLGYPEMRAFLYYARDDLQGLAMRADARDLSLADQTINTRATRALDFEVQMLQAAENAVHVLAWDLRAAVPSLLTTTSQNPVGNVADEMEESG